ncbi:hypothetical protein HK097_009184 [Rhizophlyctis rosea]|uniref:Band 7 domain-containing protein n=1 Tax=Rhizophlyctis rosea TaxID=64517 RepID=A0AAD5SJE0_9FUNG|nr:hypothetical protein HK097_009184 [Rhizophlyctis rosea]
MHYVTAGPSQYVVVTGLGVEDLRIVRKGWVWPFQKTVMLDVAPLNFTLDLQAMSNEKLEFNLPAVFTIGPKDDISSLNKYARLLGGKKDNKHVEATVKGIIEGETRVIAAGMTMEEIFKESKFFKEQVIKHVQTELEQFGMVIYNANVKQLQDSPGSEYFSYLRQKVHEGACNQAKIDVATAKMRGDIGERERHGETKQEIARIDAATAVAETERKQQKAMAEAELAKRTAELDQQIQIAQIQAKRAAEMEDAVLKKELELKRAAMETERLRADELSKAKVKYESSVQAADSKLYTAQRDADAKFYAQQREAEAAFFFKQKEAEAALYNKQKEAEGLKTFMEARAEGLKKVKEALGGDDATLMQYLMLENGLYQDLAKANAEAIKGLNPKINVWNTGASGEGDVTAPIRNIFQSLPPLLTTIQDQTGITPPSWLANMPQVSKAASQPVV